MPYYRGGGDRGPGAMYVNPPIDGLSYLNVFGGDPVNNARNLIAGGVAATVIGAPVVSSGFATFKGLTNFIQTAQQDLAESTLFLVARCTDPTETKFRYGIGTFKANTGAQAGSNLLYGNTTTCQPGVLASRNTNGTDAPRGIYASSPADKTAFTMVVARSGASINRIDDLTRGVSNIDAQTNTRSAPNGEAYRIGSSVAAGGDGMIDVRFASILPGIATDAQIAAMYAYAKRISALVGQVI